MASTAYRSNARAVGVMAGASTCPPTGRGEFRRNSQTEVARDLGGAQRVSRWQAGWRWGGLAARARNHHKSSRGAGMIPAPDG
jgi:hypothetical protein